MEAILLSVVIESEESDEKHIHQAMEQPLPFTTQDYFDEMSLPSESSIDYSDFEHIRFELGDERSDLTDGGVELED